MPFITSLVTDRNSPWPPCAQCEIALNAVRTEDTEVTEQNQNNETIMNLLNIQWDVKNYAIAFLSVLSG
jgi:cytidine deaminase